MLDDGEPRPLIEDSEGCAGCGRVAPPPSLTSTSSAAGLSIQATRPAPR